MLGAFLIAGCGSQPSEQSPIVTVANETAAMTRLRAIAEAEQSYLAETGKYATLEELMQRGMVGDPSKGKLSGYKFEVVATAKGFQAVAVPEEYGVTGKRSFYIDQSNTMRGKDRKGERASAADPVV